ncbi:MAG: hypothetical protein Q9201_007693 [Fulgogasparrea decipioides]
MRSSANKYDTFPSLRKPENSILLLILWCPVLSDRSSEFLRLRITVWEWADSEDGQKLHEQLARDVQGSQNVQQLALDMAGLIKYRRLRPDPSDDMDQPITSSYLVDLDTLFRGHSLGNSGRVVEQMVFAFIRVLRRMGHHKELVEFLDTVLDREPPSLHPSDKLTDEYLERRIHGWTHKIAFETVMKQVSCLELPGLGRDNDSDQLHRNSSDWILVQHSPTSLCSDYISPAAETRSSTEQSHSVIPLKINITQTTEVSTTTANAQEDMTPSHDVVVSSHRDERHLSSPPGLCADDYTLIRLPNVADRRLLEKFVEEIGPAYKVPNIEKLDDGSWEICILKLSWLVAQRTLDKMLPNRDIDLHYSPFEPTAQHVEVSGYDTAKAMVRRSLFEGSIRVVREGWSVATIFYSSLLEVMLVPDEAAAEQLQPASDTYIPSLISK